MLGSVVWLAPAFCTGGPAIEYFIVGWLPIVGMTGGCDPPGGRNFSDVA